MESEFIRKLLYSELHKAIDDSASVEIDELDNSSLSYPPGSELSSSELSALKSLSEDARSGLRKLLLDSSAYPSFHLLSLLDGVTEPANIDKWSGLSLVAKEDKDEGMMHDEFYASFWDHNETKS